MQNFTLMIIILNLIIKTNLGYLQTQLALEKINLNLQKVILQCAIIEKMINVHHGNKSFSNDS